MTRVWVGFAGPFFATAVVFIVVKMNSLSPSIEAGVLGGSVIALIQSQLSILAMKWSWNTKWFYWMWGGGMLVRMCVFALTAFFVYQTRVWNFLAAMLSLVVATTIFLVFESMTIFWKKR